MYVQLLRIFCMNRDTYDMFMRHSTLSSSISAPSSKTRVNNSGAKSDMRDC